MYNSIWDIINIEHMDYDVDPYIDFANGGNDITNYINRVDAGDWRSKIALGESQSSWQRLLSIHNKKQQDAIKLFNKAKTNRK